MTDTRYFSKSWELMTKNKGWIKPVLVLALVPLVPIAGILGMYGYCYQWAVLSAWGVESSPKQSGVKVGECIKTGWRCVVVSLVWIVCVGILWSLVCALLGAIAKDLLSGLLGLATFVGMFLLGLVISVANLRAVIDQKIAAGLNPVRVFEMVRRAPGSLFKIVAISLVSAAISFGLSLVMYFILAIMLAGKFVELAYLTAGGYTAQVAGIISSLIGTALPIVLLFGYAYLIVMAATMLLTCNSVGLWMSQFNVRAWGGPSDPLPLSTPPAPEPAPAPPAPQGAAQPDPDVVPQPTPTEPADSEASGPVVPAPQELVAPARPDGDADEGGDEGTAAKSEQ